MPLKFGQMDIILTSDDGFDMFDSTNVLEDDVSWDFPLILVSLQLRYFCREF